MFSASLAGDHLYGKWLFIRLSLVMSLMVSYRVVSFFHDMWNLIESVPENFTTYLHV